jgi:hypothetical protein
VSISLFEHSITSLAETAINRLLPTRALRRRPASSSARSTRPNARRLRAAPLKKY